MRSFKKTLSLITVLVLSLSLLAPAAGLTTAKAETSASDLFISEYIEGSSFNKAIELYNGTGTEVDLSAYSLELYSNGATTASQKVTLSGTLANGDVYVLYHGQASESIKAVGDLESTSVINFNGDDALVLKKNGEIIDSFGQVGVDPGAAWGTDVKTVDFTLVRNPSVTAGDTNPNDAFDPAAEYIGHPKDTFTFLGSHNLSTEEPEVPEEILTIAEARTEAEGTKVAVKGIVTAILNNTIHIQDETAALAIYPVSAADAEIGDQLTISGTLSNFRGLLQLTNPTVIEKLEQFAVPEPVLLTGAELNEQNESKLATIQNVTISSIQSQGSGWFNYTATDGTEFTLRDENASLGLQVGKTYDLITGIVQQYNDTFQIIPRTKADIIEDSTTVQPVFAIPGAGTVPSGTLVELQTYTKDATIFYTTDGSDPVQNGQVYEEPITLQDDTVIKAYATKDGLNPSLTVEYSYLVYNAEEGIKIHHIQGEGHYSSLDGQIVNGVEGVVTYKYELNGSYYFHMQTPEAEADNNPKTSEGIVVYLGRNQADVEIGDLVAVTGTVDEYAIDGYSDRQDTDLPITQINARDDRNGIVEVVEENVELPAPFAITSDVLPNEVIDNDGFGKFDPEEDAIDFWESLEGMLVEVGHTKAVAPQEHGDLIVVLEGTKTTSQNGGLLISETDYNPERIQFKLYPNDEARDFAVKTGDKFKGPIVGVVNYGFQNYKIYADLEDLQEAHVEVNKTKPETSSLKPQKDKVTIASYNLENFSNNWASDETPAEKAEKIARAFVENLNSPDIIGVTEVQDNNGQDEGPADADASESYQRLIDAIAAAGGPRYEYVNINPEYNEDGGAPNANIRVGFLYNPARVSLADGAPAGTANEAVAYENGKLTLNPGRVDPTNVAFDDSRKPLTAQFEFQGESLVVIANHFNSKSGDTALFGTTQPPVLGSETQRLQIAAIINSFVKAILAENPNENVVVLGDLNDFEFSKALQIVKGNELTNMIESVPVQERYTYLFQGNSQVLDHILVSNNLVKDTKVDVIHINADFTDMHGRASDHDPVMIQIEF